MGPKMILMRFNHLLLVSLLMAGAAPGARLAAQGTVCRDLRTMLSLMDTVHVRPLHARQGLPDIFPRLFFDALDPSGLFFTKTDRETLVQTARQGGAGLEKDCALYTASVALYRKRLKSADSVLIQLAMKAPDYALAEYWVEDISAIPACSQADRLRQLVKLQVLETYISRSAESRGTFAAAEAEIRTQVCERFRCRIKRKQTLPEGLDAFIGNIFLNAVATCYDPHSAYFTQEVKQGFESSLSANAETFGFWVGENDGEEIVVDYLMPGGPAWNSDALKKDEVIVAMKFGNNPPLNMACASAEEINEMLASMPANKLEIKVRRENGQTETLAFHAREMEVEENSVSSFLLSGKIKAGYLYLPGFYSDWGDGNVQGCANDVARELLKMREAGTEGIILDLRGNGGGSVEEAIQLAGIFINEGPMGIFVDGKNTSTVLRDRNRGAMYTGPLVVMVDCWSASASEMFAAIMQDYNRAVVVGDTTYGKATAQSIFPLPGNPSAFVKITTNHFLRVTGKSHQGTGVYPDVVFPVGDPEEEREGDQPQVLKPGGLSKEVKYQPLTGIPVDRLQQAAGTWGGNSPGIALSASLYERLTVFYDTLSKLMLKPEVFLQYDKEWEEIIHQSKYLDSLQVDTYSATIPPHMNAVMELDSVLKETLEIQRKDVQQDVKIAHAFQVLSDMIKP